MGRHIQPLFLIMYTFPHIFYLNHIYFILWKTYVNLIYIFTSSLFIYVIYVSNILPTTMSSLCLRVSSWLFKAEAN